MSAQRIQMKSFSGPPSPPGVPWWAFVLGGSVILLVVAILAARHTHRARAARPVEAPPAAQAAVAPAPAPEVPSAPLPPLARMVLPTPRVNLLDAPIAEVIQPTGSGRPESGLYGSVRTSGAGKRIAASFHEGIDISPLARDRAGRALDEIFAVADGKVGYVSRHAGNSSYGNYVVLLHDDPAGEVYTLYGHLAEVKSGLAAGQTVKAGAVVGRMGHTGTQNVPRSRSHLHFEIGMIANERFAQYMQSIRTRNSHGRYNGWNFLGVDPLAALRAQRDAGASFTFLSHLASVPVAFEMLLPAKRLPDFFRRHPRLWEGGDFHGPALVVACSEAGLPLRGRPATPEEAARLTGRKPVVLSADATVLGRNGRHLVSATRSGGWTLGSQGQRWADILLFH